ncbi:MAG: PfkB family carbohydrate kinase [Candidatus Methanoperedens sp.]|nr:PfkB family carbohydrate kinase [Candidatus Methanoperedens sp.]MCZ7371204.1 PfkB family carbohydrate kinase [Candidatus Methanoperedens sp.]
MSLNYSNKIKTIEELCEIIGQPPREKKVVMCHGTFDIVHPGHIRHLTYAKEKGDILIASFTADKFISKGEDRPYVPQELRAKNLAALEMVDYVIVDYEATPIKNILKIKPDFFVKGFEYSKDGIHPKTKEEIKAISSYGGEVLFSPGDVVYSSTHLLTVHKPKISIDKLMAIMEAEKVTFEDILSTLHKFRSIKVHVVGDTIVDKYSYCTVLGPTTKTPTFSIKLETSKMFVGGAGIVAKHLKSLGADVTFTTVLGNDNLKDFVIDDLNKWDIKINAIIDNTRPTTMKERFWADGYKLLQVDTLDNSIVSEKILEEIGNQIRWEKSDIVIFSDFRHGIFQKETIKLFSRKIHQGAIKVADSQVSNRWGNILEFKNFDIILPNEKEARFALGDQDTGIRPLGAKLYKESKARYLILKLGEKGILVYRDVNENPRDFFMIDSFVEDLVDATGAGDAMLAATSLAYKASNNILTSSVLGSMGAAIACEKEGNIPISIEEIEAKIKKIHEQKFA